MLAVLIFSWLCLLFLPTLAVYDYEETLWARYANASGVSPSDFYSVTSDSNGNVYAVGIIGTDNFNFGNGVKVAGTYSKYHFALIVKYNNSGYTQWATTVTCESTYGASTFDSVTVDNSGNIYASGFIFDRYRYYFGNGITANGTIEHQNMVLVKYNSSGIAQWAKAKNNVTGILEFYSLATDSSGNVYAAGSFIYSGTYDFGNGITISIPSYFTGFYVVVLVKYDSSGNALWAKTDTGWGDAKFNSITLDSNGNIYAAGYISDSDTYNFGNNVTANFNTTVHNFKVNGVVIVKYDSSGNTQWAKSVYSPSSSIFNSVTIDSSGNIFAFGQLSSYTYNFGNGVTITGYQESIVLVKYDSSGNAQWVKPMINNASGIIEFYSVTIDSSDNFYFAGSIERYDCTYDFGNGVTIAGLDYSVVSVVLVKYNSSGNAQWAKTVKIGMDDSKFESVTVDSSGNIYAAGWITGYRSYDFGNGVTATGTSTSDNFVLVKYGILILQSIAVTPNSSIISDGLTQQFNATGIYSNWPTADLTTLVTWTSDNTVVATIDGSTGLATAVAAFGSATITATFGNISSTAILTVTSHRPTPTLTPTLSPTPMKTPTPTPSAASSLKPFWFKIFQPISRF